MATDATSPPKKRGGRKPGQKNLCSAATISFDIRVAMLTSLNFLGKVKYLVALARTEPSAYANLLGKCLVSNDSGEAQGLTITVQQLVMPAGPIPGVLNSPIAEHIGPPRLIAHNGAVLDMETSK